MQSTSLPLSLFIVFAVVCTASRVKNTILLAELEKEQSLEEKITAITTTDRPNYGPAIKEFFEADLQLKRKEKEKEQKIQKKKKIQNKIQEIKNKRPKHMAKDATSEINSILIDVFVGIVRSSSCHVTYDPDNEQNALKMATQTVLGGGELAKYAVNNAFFAVFNRRLTVDKSNLDHDLDLQTTQEYFRTAEDRCSGSFEKDIKGVTYLSEVLQYVAAEILEKGIDQCQGKRELTAKCVQEGIENDEELKKVGSKYAQHRIQEISNFDDTIHETFKLSIDAEDPKIEKAAKDAVDAETGSVPPVPDQHMSEDATSEINSILNNIMDRLVWSSSCNVSFDIWTEDKFRPLREPLTKAVHFQFVGNLSKMADQNAYWSALGLIGISPVRKELAQYLDQSNTQEYLKQANACCPGSFHRDRKGITYLAAVLEYMAREILESAKRICQDDAELTSKCVWEGIEKDGELAKTLGDRPPCENEAKAE